jgi:hypothetical protein
MVFITYLTQSYAIRRRYKLSPAQILAGTRPLEQKVRQFLAQSGITDDVELCFSAHPNISPQTFGGFRKPVVVLPANFNEILEAVKRKVGPLADALSEFILRHEVAHIANRDYFSYTWGVTFLRLILVLWIPALVTAYYLGVISRGAEFTAASLPSTYVAFALFVILGSLCFCLHSLCREREFEADSKVAEQMDAAQLGVLLAPNIALANQPPLQFVLDFFARHSFFMGVAFTGQHGSHATMTGRIGEMLEITLSSHPSHTSRIANLSTPKQTILRSLSVDAGVLMGAVISVLVILTGLLAYGLLDIRLSSRTLTLSWILATLGLGFPLTFQPVRSGVTTGLSFQDLSRQMVSYLIASALTATAITSIELAPFFLHVLRVYVAGHTAVFLLSMIGLAKCPGELSGFTARNWLLAVLTSLIMLLLITVMGIA